MGKDSDNSIESASGPRLTSFNPKIKAKNDSNNLSYNYEGGEEEKGRRSAADRMAAELVSTVRNTGKPQENTQNTGVRKLKIISGPTSP